MLEDLRDYGIIWQRKASDKRIACGIESHMTAGNIKTILPNAFGNHTDFFFTSVTHSQRFRR